MTSVQKARFLQVVLEATLPIIGYIYWNWDTSFILQFYCLEWVLILILTGFKSKKRYAYLGDPSEKKEAIYNISFGTICFLLTCLLIGFTLPQLENNFSWMERVYAFMSYSDMGIAQGYLLIPILILNGIMVYKQQFIALERHKNRSMDILTKEVKNQGKLLVLFGFLLFGMSFVFMYPPEIILFGTIAGTSVYKLMIKA